jgi:hypothetical protein
LPEFYALYYEHVFVKKCEEYLTEKQMPQNSPMAVDFDFRYSLQETTRQHTHIHIESIINAYLKCIRFCYDVSPATPIDIYVFEKPTINPQPDKSFVKDGIHIIFGIQIDH